MKTNEKGLSFVKDKKHVRNTEDFDLYGTVQE